MTRPSEHHVSTGTYLELHWDALQPSETVNARAGEYTKEGIAELAALIKTKGLIQPLIVRRIGRGNYEVYAGGRRYAAIGVLIESGDWPSDKRVACVERNEEDDEALETSLVENIAREAMHPVREFEVFAALHGKGADVEGIARRYGVTEKAVRQRLALGGLAPEIRKAWRNRAINGDTAQAFAVCRDAKKQSAAYKQLEKQRSLQAGAVRRHFAQDKPKITDARVAFVGVERYKEAGGAVVESLFANDGWIEDGELLDRLAAERLTERCEELVAEGWAWASPASEVPANVTWQWQRLQAKISRTAEEKARLKEIENEMGRLEAAGAEWDDERIDALHDERQAIEDAAQARGYIKKQKAESGCLLSVSDDGVSITYGLVRPKAGDKKKDRDATGQNAADAGEPEGRGISNALLLSLTEQQTVAAARTLAEAPIAALKFAIAGLRSGFSPVKIRGDGFRGIASAREQEDFVEVLRSLNGTGVELEAELARTVALTLDLRLYSGGEAMHSGIKEDDPSDTEALIAALPGEAYLAAMRELFEPEDYFKRAPARIAHAAIEELPAEEPAILPGIKKADLAAIAAVRAKRLGWLPPELRHPEYALIGQVCKKCLQPAKGRGRRKAAREAAA